MLVSVIVLSVLSLFVILTSIFTIWYVFERMRLLRAKRIEAEKKAQVHTVINDGQVYIRDTNPNATWRAAHLDTRVHIDSQEYNPSQIEIDTWNRLHRQKIPQLPSKIAQVTSKTLYEILGTFPHLMLIGGSGSGKTTQMTNAIEYHLKQSPDADVCWLSTHAKMDKAQIHSKAIIIQKPDTIMQALSAIFKKYEYRRDTGDIGRKIVVALDEWDELVNEYKEAGRFLIGISSGARKTNISLILASHGSNVGDLGIKGHSFAKSNFAEIYLNTQDRSKAVWHHKSSKEEITLPSSDDNNSLILELESINKQVLDMIGKGYSYRKISKEVWGGIGSYYNKKIDKIVSEYEVR